MLSRAFCAGLIEAVLAGNWPNGNLRLSRAFCAGLIEACLLNHFRTLFTSYPVRFARASLKQQFGTIRQFAHWSYPVRFARASLKLAQG